MVITVLVVIVPLAQASFLVHPVAIATRALFANVLLVDMVALQDFPHLHAQGHATEAFIVHLAPQVIRKIRVP